MNRITGKHWVALWLCLMAFVGMRAHNATDSLQHEVLIETTMGRVRVTLYNDTPKHRDNFLKLVREGYYDGLLFHRVIPGFMIQAGDSASRHAVPEQKLGDSPEAYTIPAEIRFPERFHKCGALAAAREGDEVNPERASSSTQFYIVNGRMFDDDQLAAAQEYLDEQTGGKIKLTPEVKEVYRSYGGAPHLDGLYTVFGEVIEGLDIVDQIQWVERNADNRPKTDVRIVRATVVK